VRNPSVFLLDEPLSNIDAKLRLEMRAELIRLQKDLQTTMIYVTHDQIEALTMADRIAVMDKGRVLQVGDPIEIFQNPTSKFVGGFIGSPPMNFIDCALVEKDSRTFLQTSTFSIVISSELGKALKEKAAGRELLLGVRPHDVLISREKTLSDQVEGEIYAVEHLGTETLVDMSKGSTILRGVTPGAFKAQLGEKVWFLFNEKGIHIFDRKTEKALI
jgi:multiple sugar transport system ATP-binding protein